MRHKPGRHGGVRHLLSSSSKNHTWHTFHGRYAVLFVRCGCHWPAGRAAFPSALCCSVIRGFLDTTPWSCGAQQGTLKRKSVTWADEAPAADGFHFSDQRQARVLSCLISKDCEQGSCIMQTSLKEMPCFCCHTHAMSHCALNGSLGPCLSWAEGLTQRAGQGRLP